MNKKIAFFDCIDLELAKELSPQKIQTPLGSHLQWRAISPSQDSDEIFIEVKAINRNDKEVLAYVSKGREIVTNKT